METLDDVLDRSGIVVCIGSGGVGKTTVAASLGFAAASRGRRALVITIDPARRLADALGVTDLGDEPQKIIGDAGTGGSGSLFAMMLDPKQTLDALVERFTPSTAARDRILDNTLYQHISASLSGSVEYAAMEKVSELIERDDFDLIVLDTPPSDHAFDFLAAPERLIGFFDSPLVAMLVQPALRAGRFGFRFFERPARGVLGLIERVSGLHFVEDLSEFLIAFDTVSTGFRERAAQASGRLKGPDAAFVLVTGPQRDRFESACELLTRLEENSAPTKAVVVNRVRTWQGQKPLPDSLLTNPTPKDEIEALASALGEPSETAREFARAAFAAARGYARAVKSDARQVSEWKRRARAAALSFNAIPELDQDIHNLDGIRQLAVYLGLLPARPAEKSPE